MKMSLREMTWGGIKLASGPMRGGRRAQCARPWVGNVGDSYVFVLEMLEKLQFPVGPLGQDGRAERLHNLLDGYILVRELVAGGAVGGKSAAMAQLESFFFFLRRLKKTYQTRPKAPMPTGWRSEYLRCGQGCQQTRVGRKEGHGRRGGAGYAEPCRLA